MKKALALALAFIMVFALCACGQQASQPVASSSDTASASNASSADSGAAFEPMTWKFACSNSETSTWMAAGRYFGDLVSEATGGAVKVEYYPSDQLTSGNQTEGIQAIMDGTTSIGLHSNIIYSSFDDRFSVVTLPFLFGSTEEADTVLDGEGGNSLRAVLEEHNLHLLGIGENGFRNITNNKREIKTPDDLKDLVIRVAGSSVLLKAYELWGANYTKANLSEVYTGLQTGTFDGEENPFGTISSESFNEVQKYMTLWTGAYDCIFFSMNADLYNSLSPELQKIVDEAGQKACEYQREQNRAGDEQFVKDWTEKNGMIIREMTSDEATSFKNLSQPVYGYYRDILVENGMNAEDAVAYIESFGAKVD